MKSPHHHEGHFHDKKDQHLFLVNDHRFQCSLRTHDGAVVLSFQVLFQGILAEAEPKIKELFAELNRFVQQNNGIVGHIKAHGKECCRSLCISCTNGTAEGDLREETYAEITGTAIVFLVDPQDFLAVFEENSMQIF